MAQSSVHSTGTLPDGWKWAKIGEITHPVGKVKPADNPDTEFIYLDISSIDNSINRVTEPKVYLGADAPSRARQSVQTHDVLFSTVRTYLRNIALVPEQHDGQIASTGFSVLRGKGGVAGKYLFYFTLTDDFIATVTALQRGVSYPAVRDRDVRSQRIPVAPLPEQHRIVAEIETQFTRLEAGVAALNRTQANLRRYKASVLKAACEGRLVPTEAEMARAEGRDYESADVLLERILAERRARWETEKSGRKYKEPKPPDTSDLQELPEGWVWVSALQLATKVTDGVHKTPTYVESGVPFLSVNNMSEDGSLSFSPCKYITDQEHEELYRRCNPEMGDVLLSKVGTVGLTAVVRTDRIFSLFVNTALIKPVHGVISSEFIACALRHGFVSKSYDTYVSGSTQRFIGTTKIGQLPVPLPPLPEQRRIVAEVERRLSVVGELEKQVEAALRRAERLRQAILKHAFEGKLVPQDPNDEPASALLARIKAERSGQDGKTKGKKKGKVEQLELL